MREISRSDRMKYMQIIVCALLGMATAVFVGRSGAMTVACTAMLVVYAERGYEGSVSYIAGRIKLQVFMGAIVLGSFLLFRALLPGLLWLAEGLTLITSLTVGLVMYHNKVLGPLSISVGLTVVIMLTGIVQNPGYPLTRLLNCIYGCLLAAAVSVVPLLLGNRPMGLHRRINEVSTMLLSGPEGLAQAGALHQDNGRQLELLRKDARWERKLTDEELEWMTWRQQANGALLAVREAASGGLDSAQFQQWFHPLSREAMEAHAALLEGAEEVPLQAEHVPVSNHREAGAAVALLEYLQTLGGRCGGRETVLAGEATGGKA